MLLFIETATELVGAAVGDAGGVVAEASVTGRRRHAETLLPMVAQVVEAAGQSLRELEVIAVDVGPGLFTGLRVGVAAAKGLAQGLGLGLVGVSSLDVLARAARQAGWSGPVVAVVDARRGEVFAARYGPLPTAAPDGRAPEGANGSGGQELLAPTVCPPEVLAGELAEDPGGGWVGAPVLAVGDGARRYAELLAAVPGLRIAGPMLAAPPPGVGMLLAAERLAAGEAPVAPAALAPRYLRQADARRNWVQRAPAPGA